MRRALICSGAAGADGVASDHVHDETTRADPVWLRKAADLHGHLGAWCAAGARAGEDAVGRLHVANGWGIDVSVAIAEADRKPPRSCLIDGLQTSTRATMGKGNIRFVEPTADVPPMTIVISRTGEAGRPTDTLRYTFTERLRTRLDESTSATLAADARWIAAEPFEAMFVAVESK